MKRSGDYSFQELFGREGERGDHEPSYESGGASHQIPSEMIGGIPCLIINWFLYARKMYI